MPFAAFDIQFKPRTLAVSLFPILSRHSLAMDTYPAKGTITPSGHKTCQFDDCGTSFMKFEYLVNHIKVAHHVPSESMVGHWLHSACLRERSSTKSLGLMEAESVSLVYTESGAVDELHFGCKLCGTTLHKVSCHRHMMKQHSIAKSEVQTWRAYSDGKKIIKMKKDCTVPDHKLHLTVALLSIEGGGDVATGPGHAVAASGVEHEGMDEEEGVEEDAVEDYVDDEHAVVWRPVLCWVAFKPDGDMAEPFRCYGPVDDEPYAWDYTRGSATTIEVAPTMSAAVAAATPKAQPPVAAVPASSSDLSSLQESVNQLAGMMVAQTKGPVLEEAPPTTSISSAAAAWQPQEGELADRRRRQWPLQGRCDLTFDAFKVYMETSKCLKHVSCETHIQKLQYFVGLFDLPCTFS